MDNLDSPVNLDSLVNLEITHLQCASSELVLLV